MERNDSWGSVRSSGANVGKIVRICLALIATVSSVAIAMTFLISSHSTAHATSPQRGAKYNVIPDLKTGPVSKNWYFAEGRVGTGFVENLTINDPDLNLACSANVKYFYQRDGGSPKTKTVPVSIAAGPRVSESVNTDLGIPPGQTPGASVAATLTVNSGSCNGVVTERALYFNANNVNSGDEVMGATHLGTSFYFADMPTGTGYTSDIAVLNTNSSAAHITTNYYANGQVVGSQTATVSPLTRSTLTLPTSLPSHSAAVITSDQSVLVERSDYFNSIKVGQAGTVSGAWSTIGSSTLANDWLFAEGYTSGKFQEYLDIANLDTAKQAANVTITLYYPKQTPLTFTAKVNSQSQLIWDVNQNGVGGPSPQVSAEVSSTGAKIVVEREMYFKYNHTVNGNQVVALGGTDVMGQVGPAARTGYSFADGNTYTGYDELLIMLNPTSGSELIYVNLVNGLGVSYHLPAVRLYPHTCISINITSVVAKNMVHPGDPQQAYQVWMNINVHFNYEDFVAERLNYWNASITGLTNPTQGGTDTMGYYGY